MRGQRSSKSGLFLMELIIAIAFFAFSSAICIQLFAKARTLSAKSSDISSAVASAQSAAECFKYAGGDKARTAELLGAEGREDGLFLYYDNNWVPVAADAARFLMVVRFEEEEGLARADITIADQRSGEQLYQLSAASYGAS